MMMEELEQRLKPVMLMGLAGDAEAAERTGHSESNVKVLAHRGMKAMMAETRNMER